MQISGIIFLTLIGLLVYAILTFVVVIVTKNRNDDTPTWEPILISIIFTPILALIVETLKPYKNK